MIELDRAEFHREIGKAVVGLMNDINEFPKMDGLSVDNANIELHLNEQAGEFAGVWSVVVRKVVS